MDGVQSRGVPFCVRNGCTPTEIVGDATDFDERNQKLKPDGELFPGPFSMIGFDTVLRAGCLIRHETFVKLFIKHKAELFQPLNSVDLRLV
jgi:hypothetical protein